MVQWYNDTSISSILRAYDTNSHNASPTWQNSVRKKKKEDKSDHQAKEEILDFLNCNFDGFVFVAIRW